jgi:hypothetical protein
MENRHLSVWEERAFRLVDLTEENDLLIAKSEKFEIYLPLYLKHDLATAIGRTISILRTDMDYRMLILDV